jgi:pimeloyl-ACP methyl ester carboxylesterase
MTLTSERIELSNGLTLRAHRRPGTGVPVICMHGIWDEGAYFSELAGDGPGTFSGRPLYLVDLRGHAESDKPESGYGWQDYAGDIVCLIQDQGFEQVTLVGHSLGALTSLLVAAQIPDRIAAMVLEDPPVPLREVSGDVFSTLLDLKQKAFETVVDELHAWRPFMSREQAEGSARRLVQTADGVLSEASSGISRGVQIPVPNVTIPAPTLVIQAGYEDQRAFGVEGPALLGAVLPNLRIETIPETSHNVFREKPDEYKAIVQEWWDALYPA